MPIKGKRKNNDAGEFRKTSGASHSQDHSQIQAAASPGRIDQAKNSSFDIPDNRPRTAQLIAMKNSIQLANHNSGPRKFVRTRDREYRDINRSSVLGADDIGQNWEVLEISDYMRRHHLRLRRMSRSPEKSMMHLSDGSIIVIDSNQFWRHVSADSEGEFFDSTHGINKDSSRTHFWTRRGYAQYKLKQSA